MTGSVGVMTGSDGGMTGSVGGMTGSVGVMTGSDGVVTGSEVWASAQDGEPATTTAVTTIRDTTCSDFLRFLNQILLKNKFMHS